MAKLITAQEVINTSYTNKNTDIDLIGDAFIEVAQEEHIRPVLAGHLDDVDSLYFEIVTQNDACTLTALNTTLLNDFIKPCLAFYVKYEMLMDMLVNTSSQGLQVLNTEFSNSASSSQRADLASKAKSHADTLRDKMVRYLEDEARANDYPKYFPSKNTANRTSVIGGLLLDGDVRISDTNDPYAPR
jgi:hypothetical protein